MNELIGIKKNTNYRVISLEGVTYNLSNYSNQKELNNIIDIAIWEGNFINEFFDIEIFQISKTHFKNITYFIKSI